MRHRKHPIRFLLGHALRVSRLCNLLTIPGEGYRLQFYPTNISVLLWADPHDRDDDLRFLRNLLRPGDVMLDVGANIGQTAIVGAQSVGSSGEVHAFEPHPQVYQYLVGNLQRNGLDRVKTHNVALGSEDGTVSFSKRRADDQNSVATEATGLEVPVRRLDEFPVREGQIALLKVDVEGYEKFVLDGATALLPRVMCVKAEVSDPMFARFGQSTAQVVGLLMDAGFEVFRPGGDGHYHKLPRDHRVSTIDEVVAIRDRAWYHERTGATYVET